jgi:hypothetical protein
MTCSMACSSACCSASRGAIHSASSSSIVRLRTGIAAAPLQWRLELYRWCHGRGRQQCVVLTGRCGYVAHGTVQIYSSSLHVPVVAGDDPCPEHAEQKRVGASSHRPTTNSPVPVWCPPPQFRPVSSHRLRFQSQTPPSSCSTTPIFIRPRLLCAGICSCPLHVTSRFSRHGSWAVLLVVLGIQVRLVSYSGRSGAAPSACPGPCQPLLPSHPRFVF